VTRSRLLLVALFAVLAGPVAATANDRESRTDGTCGEGATSKLRLEPDDGEIELRFDVAHGRVSGVWRIVVVQEGRVAWRGRARARSGRLRVARRLTDLTGVDRITVRGRGPRGIVCVASGTLAG
jgi:hypothetical protein